jgi:hypothetical protein
MLFIFQDDYDRFHRFLSTEYDWLAEQLYSQTLCQADLDTFAACYKNNRGKSAPPQASPSINNNQAPDGRTHNVVSHLVEQDTDPVRQRENFGSAPCVTQGSSVNNSGINNGQEAMRGYPPDMSRPSVTEQPAQELNRSQNGLLDSSPRHSSVSSAEPFSIDQNFPISGAPAPSRANSGPGKPVGYAESRPAENGVNSGSVAGSQSPWHLSTSSSSFSLHPPCGSPWQGSSSSSLGKRIFLGF